MMKRSKSLYLLLIILLAFTGCVGKEPSNDEQSIEHSESEKNQAASSDEDAYETIVQKSNELGFHILDKVANEKDVNVFISPVSLYMALSMVYSGADGETKAEMAALLDLEDMTVHELNEANVSLLDQLGEKNEEDIKLHLANSLWLDDSFQLHPNYEKTIEQYFRGKLTMVDRMDKAAVDAMNDWAQEQTEGKLDEVVTSPLGDNFVAMLMNVVYFNGKWTYPFDEATTAQGTFYLTDGQEIDVPFMHLKEKLNYVKKADYEAVRLPYGEEGEMGMYLFLPTETGNIASIHEAFMDTNAIDILAEMQRTEGTVSLPKFELAYEQEMNDVLQQLGMGQVFDVEEAALPHIIASEDQLHISEVKHMTYLDVNEAGTEAAGSTSIGIDTMSIPTEESFDLTFNHPFVMLIVDDETNTILFAGDMYDVSH